MVDSEAYGRKFKEIGRKPNEEKKYFEMGSTGRVIYMGGGGLVGNIRGIRWRVRFFIRYVCSKDSRPVFPMLTVSGGSYLLQERFVP